MTYKKRFDGRDWNELRPIEAKAGVIKNADGSAYFKIGNTIAYAAVYGPRELYPRFLQNPKKGILRCYYNIIQPSCCWRIEFQRLACSIPRPFRNAVGGINDREIIDIGVSIFCAVHISKQQNRSICQVKQRARAVFRLNVNINKLICSKQFLYLAVFGNRLRRKYYIDNVHCFH